MWLRPVSLRVGADRRLGDTALPASMPIPGRFGKPSGSRRPALKLDRKRRRRLEVGVRRVGVTRREFAARLRVVDELCRGDRKRLFVEVDFQEALLEVVDVEAHASASAVLNDTAVEILGAQRLDEFVFAVDGRAGSALRSGRCG